MHDQTSFLDSFFEQISQSKLDVSNLILDHIAYQAATSQEYDQLKPLFIDLGKPVHEEIISDRRVSVFKLHKPMQYKNYAFSALELIEPKENQVCQSGYQHAEFIAEKPFEEYMQEYPDLKWDTSSMNRSAFSHLKLNFDNGLTLKFLQKPILELVTNN